MSFEKILIKSPNVIICHAGALILCLGRTQQKDLQDLQEGAKLLVRAASGSQITDDKVDDAE